MGLFEKTSDCVGHHDGYFALGAGQGPERIAMMAMRAIALAKAS